MYIQKEINMQQNIKEIINHLLVEVGFGHIVAEGEAVLCSWAMPSFASVWDLTSWSNSKMPQANIMADTPPKCH